MKVSAAVAIAFVLVQTSLANSGCPQNSRQLGKICYAYKAQSLGFHQANQICQRWAKGGQLATVSGKTVNDFLFTAFGKGKSRRVWIGASRQDNGYSWKYPDGKTTVPFTNWHGGEPNDSGGNENCVEMREDASWNDVQCSKHNPFICEVQADIDECALGTAKCDKHATCVNTFGQYNCTCKPGYYGNGTHCTATFYTYHDKILRELQYNEKMTDKKLTNIEHMLYKLLGKPGTKSSQKKSASK